MPAVGTGVTIPNTFAGESGFVPASQLDVDFTTLATALNTLATFGNYLVDSGSANGIVVSTTADATLVATLIAGLPLQIKVAAANVDTGGTGATTINMNGLGTKNLTYPSLAALLPGQLKAGAIIQVMYDGTQFQYLGPIFGSGQFSGTVTGFTGGTTPTPTLVWSISDFHAGVAIPAMSGTSNSVSFLVSNLPAYLRPTRGQYCACPANLFFDNGSAVPLVSANVTGAILTLLLAGGNWTASGTKGSTGEIFISFLLN